MKIENRKQKSEKQIPRCSRDDRTFWSWAKDAGLFLGRAGENGVRGMRPKREDKDNAEARRTLRFAEKREARPTRKPGVWGPSGEWSVFSGKF